MAPKSQKRIPLPRQKYIDYTKVAQNFFLGAEAAKTFEYWNAAGVLIIHCAIALADALTIKVGGYKSRGDDHMEILDHLRELIIPNEAGTRALAQLSRMIHQKNLVSYSGEMYTQKDIDSLWKQLERYRIWALSILG